MRRSSVLLVAATAALFPVPAAYAHDLEPADDSQSACPAPDVVAQYHPDRLSLYVTLPTAGCPTREKGDFSLQAWVSRVDEHTGEGHGRVVPCGPFSSSSSSSSDHAGADSPDRWDTCELDIVLPHPSPEAAHYDIAITYPGADGEETIESHSFCTTGDDGAFCVAAEPRAEEG